MACKGARKRQVPPEIQAADIRLAEEEQPETTEVESKAAVERLLFGVDSRTPADTLLQNNITAFEWAVRNKRYPNFWGRNMAGEQALTKSEIDFLHSKGCKVAAIYPDSGEKRTEGQGQALAEKIKETAVKLEIPQGTAIFLEISEEETATRDFMRGVAGGLLRSGFVPGFRANTDARYSFDYEYSRGMQTDRDLFSRCLIWAVAPGLKEYDRVTTTHLIHPDNWIPFAPSAIKRNDIAVWQYGKNCHPIDDDAGNETTFNVDLVKNDRVIMEKMF